MRLLFRNQGRGQDLDAGVGFELNALHPEDGSLPLENRPLRSLRAGDFEALEDFLHLFGAGGMAQGDSVAGFPGTEGGARRRIGLREAGEADFDAKGVSGSVGDAGDGNA